MGEENIPFRHESKIGLGEGNIVAVVVVRSVERMK